VSESVAVSTKSGISENFIAAVSYVTFVPAIYFLIIPRYNKSSYIRFHAWQSLVLDCFAFLVSVILSILVRPAFHTAAGAQLVEYALLVSWGIWFGLWIVTAIAAMRGSRFKIWIIGNLAAKQAGE
jgi:uncharacterized membrane protein